MIVINSYNENVKVLAPSGGRMPMHFHAVKTNTCRRKIKAKEKREKKKNDGHDVHFHCSKAVKLCYMIL